MSRWINDNDLYKRKALNLHGEGFYWLFELDKKLDLLSVAEDMCFCLVNEEILFLNAGFAE